MNFEFATATRIVFGAGKLAEIGALVRGFGERALVVTGGNPGRALRLLELLSGEHVVTTRFPVSGEPTVALVEQGMALAKANGCQMVVSFGGGSAIDAGKAIAAMMTNDGSVLDYVEVIGRGKTLTTEAWLSAANSSLAVSRTVKMPSRGWFATNTIGNVFVAGTSIDFVSTTSFPKRSSISVCCALVVGFTTLVKMARWAALSGLARTSSEPMPRLFAFCPTR